MNQFNSYPLFVISIILRITKIESAISFIYNIFYNQAITRIQNPNDIP